MPLQHVQSGTRQVVSAPIELLAAAAEFYSPDVFAEVTRGLNSFSILSILLVSSGCFSSFCSLYSFLCLFLQCEWLLHTNNIILHVVFRTETSEPVYVSPSPLISTQLLTSVSEISVVCWDSEHHL